MMELVDKFERFLTFLPHIRKKVFAGCPAIDDLNMTPAQYTTLHVISRREEWRMTDLSSVMHVSAGSLTTMMNRLIELDMVSRVRSSTDRRVVIVCLTDRGKSVMKTGRDHMRNTMSTMLLTLNQEDQDLFKESLDNINDVMSRLL